jgi:hypothetical protein
MMLPGHSIGERDHVIRKTISIDRVTLTNITTIEAHI